MKLVFDVPTLAAIVAELQPLVGCKVQRISQPHELQIVLSIFVSGAGEQHLLIDASPRFFRAHLTTNKGFNLPTPSPFLSTLRKYLLGARVLSVAQRAGDRILDLRLGRDGDEYLLTAELMGRHSNLILVAPDGIILQAIKLISSKQNRVREILPGRRYLSPPAAPARTATEKPATVINSAQLDEYYAKETPRTQLQDATRALLGALQKHLKQKRLALSQVERGVGESTRAADMRRRGELLLGNLHDVKAQLESGAQEVEVSDFYSADESRMRIPLDPQLSAAENAERLFARARHLDENAAELLKLQNKLRQEVDELEALVEDANKIEECDDALDKHRTLQQRAAQEGWLRAASEDGQRSATSTSSKQSPHFDGYKIKRFVSPDGYEILVGENATANDYLVTRLSHSNDWWLHLRGGTSSHAIIRTRNAPDRVPQSTLRFAADLVVARSVAKHAGYAEVDYTLRKYVRKPRKAAPGAVTYTNGKTLQSSKSTRD
jgi:predicted ribosome quality control (RQC) complex YloA/Tae2 family protein